MAMQNARDVVTIIDQDEFPAERISVTVLEEHLLAGSLSRGVKIHRDVLTVKRKAGEGHTLGWRTPRHLNGRRIFYDLLRIIQRLARVPKLQSAQLSRPFHSDKGRVFILDSE